jgi:methyl-accepting chemotaxis protein
MNGKLRNQLIIWFLALSIIPLGLVSVISYLQAQASLQAETSDSLTAVSSSRQSALERLFRQWREDVMDVSGDPDVVSGLAMLSTPPAGATPEELAADQAAHDARYQSLHDYFAGYISIHHYEDALLVDASGKVVFVTNDIAAVGDDLNAGTFKNSTIDDLHDRLSALTVGDTYIVDMAKMPNGSVAIFVGAPVFDGTTRLGSLIYQPSLDQINERVAGREGMGQTGEVYVVGPDFRMRSDSILDPVNRSVAASFAGTIEQNGVDTEAARAALAGQEATETITDYRGQEVLSSHHTLQVEEGLVWAILGEQDTAESFASVNQLLLVMVALTVASIVVVAIVAFFVARQIANPVNALTQVASSIAAGDLAQRASAPVNNEVGLLAETFNGMANSLQQMVESERAAREQLETTVSNYLKFVEQVAQGDLTRRLSINGNGNGHNGTTGEVDPLHILGENLNAMVDNLANMANQTREVGSRLSSAAAEILAATTQQLSSITEQDASVTQTSTTVDEVRATVAQMAERAELVAATAQRSVEISQRGQLAVNDSVKGMRLIQERVEGIAENILALSEKTQQIGEIIASVNDIAEQSKMLALNASIEASRAGEEGKGFAVVAMEVRSLADQSREATDQVRLILNEIQQATNAAVMATEEGSKGVDAGQTQVEQAGQVIEELAEVIREASLAATQIAASTRQQSTGMDQLAMAMDTIRQASVQSQSSTQQAERSAQDLNAMAKQMTDAINTYQL